MFKKGGYRSFPNYLSRAKDAHLEQQYGWTDELARAARRVQRSVLRGLGAGRQSAEYSVAKIAALEEYEDAVVAGGPLGPKNYMISSAFFLLREIEASTALASHIEWVEGGRKVKWWVPASKTDI